MHFDRKGSCDTSDGSGIFNACEERKYTALREICCSNTKFFMFHHIPAYQKMYVRDLQKL